MLKVEMLKVEPKQFVRLLTNGQTKPALVEIDGQLWVLRYPRSGDKQLRLASEFMGYRVAAWLGVSTPTFSLARVAAGFQARTSSSISPGLCTATRWIDGGQSPDLEHEPLASFWEREQYLVAVAAARVADTWMMNYDRRRPGNVVIRGNSESPELYFLDFDQAFLGPSVRNHRPHWIEPGFKDEMLNHRELLSGFSGNGSISSERSMQRRHFESCVEHLRSVTPELIEEAMTEIPCEWGLTEADRLAWTTRFRARHAIVLDILKQMNLA